MKTKVLLILASLALWAVPSIPAQSSGSTPRPCSLPEPLKHANYLKGTPALSGKENPGTCAWPYRATAFDDGDPWFPPAPFSPANPHGSRIPGMISVRKEDRRELSVEIVGTPPGNHDSRILDAIKTRWRQLFEDSRFLPRPGLVILEFDLNTDGHVINLTEKRNDVGTLLGLLCQSAVRDPAPYRMRPDQTRPLPGQARPGWTLRFAL